MRRARGSAIGRNYDSCHHRGGSRRIGGGRLRKAGLDFTIFEKEQQVGASWRKHYTRLHLHTVKQYSSLPFLPFPETYPRYVPRDLMIRYLEHYAAHFDLQPRFAETVSSVRRDEQTWITESTSGSVRAPFVVIASGYNAERVSPSFVGTETFKGKVIHSADYVDAKPFVGQSVLVIGMGNTGAEIGLDLGGRWCVTQRSRCATGFTLFRVSFWAFQFRLWECSRQLACFPPVLTIGCFPLET